MKVAQSCLTLCDPMDYTVHGILQAKILEWVAFPFSRGSSQPRDWTQVSCTAGGFFTNWAIREAQEHEWVAYPFPKRILYQLSYQGSPNRNVNFCLIQILSNFPEGDDSVPFGLIFVHVTFLSVECVSFGHNLEPLLDMRFLYLI